MVKHGYEIDANRGSSDSVHFTLTDPDGNQVLFNQQYHTAGIVPANSAGLVPQLTATPPVGGFVICGFG